MKPLHDEYVRLYAELAKLEEIREVTAEEFARVSAMQFINARMEDPFENRAKLLFRFRELMDRIDGKDIQGELFQEGIRLFFNRDYAAAFNKMCDVIAMNQTNVLAILKAFAARMQTNTLREACEWFNTCHLPPAIEHELEGDVLQAYNLAVRIVCFELYGKFPPSPLNASATADLS